MSVVDAVTGVVTGGLGVAFFGGVMGADDDAFSFVCEPLYAGIAGRANLAE